MGMRILLALGTGLRRGDIKLLRVSDLDFENSYESALKRCFVAKLSLKIDVIGQIGALDFAVIHIIGFLDQTQLCYSN